MPYTELVKWVEYFKLRPVGWREDQRTYLTLRTQGVKANAEDIFPTLRLIKINEINSQKPDQAVPKGTFLEKLRNATRGDSDVNLF